MPSAPLALDDLLESLPEVLAGVGVEQRVERAVEVGQPEGRPVDGVGHKVRVDGADVEDHMEGHPAE